MDESISENTNSVKTFKKINYHEFTSFINKSVQ